jgi:kynurenine formamidase
MLDEWRGVGKKQVITHVLVLYSHSSTHFNVTAHKHREKLTFSNLTAFMQ